jgi:hypothetical protein
MTIPIRRRIVTWGEPLPIDGLPGRRRVTTDASPPATLSAAIEPSMVEKWRGPNSGAYSLLVDSATNEMVLFNYPTTMQPHAGEPRPPRLAEPPGAEKLPPRYIGITGNPDGGPVEPLALGMAAPRELRQTEDDWRRAVNEPTKDAADRAFEARVHRLRTGIRMRALNDANRAHYRQPPIGGGPDKAA